MTENHPILHLYEQPSHHMDAYIFGNRLGLETLRDAINRTLSDEIDEMPAEVYQGDGEFYYCFVRLAGSNWMKLAPNPYSDFNGIDSEEENRAFAAIYDGRARKDSA